MKNVPEELTDLKSFLHLIDFVDRSSICPGIDNQKFKELAHSGGRNGVFKDCHGKTTANLSNNTIRPVDCRSLWHSGIACGPCKAYRKTLLTMRQDNAACLNVSHNALLCSCSQKILLILR